MTYKSFLDAKATIDISHSEIVPEDISDQLFDYQEVIVRWALRRGRACVFADCGMGKALIALEWGTQVVNATKRPVLLLAPLAVSHQFLGEAEKFGYKIHLVKSAEDVVDGAINCTNYEKLHNFDTSVFVGVICDESSVIKSFEGKLRNQIITSFKDTPYRLACTATPAPNDHMELGNHAEFMGVMTRTEMLSMFFVHDGGSTSQWRLKRHAEDAFWKWMASWAVCLRKPSDLGFSDAGFVLPKLNIHKHILPSDLPEAQTLNEHRAARKASLSVRVEACAEIVNESDDPWLVWCDFNDEGNALETAIEGSVQVAGSDTDERKTKLLHGFSKGKYTKLISKPKIAGWGMNWQHCSNIAFVGISHSFESFYQAIRRCWRYGQDQEVDVHLFLSKAELPAYRTIVRKQKDAARLAKGMTKHMQSYTSEEIKRITRDEMEYKEEMKSGKGWKAVLGDCVDTIGKIRSSSIHYSVFSPPFADLFCYSNSARDMGNCHSNDEFMQHFKYLVDELYRVIMPGRLVSFHCMNLPSSKTRDGVIGLKDFRGDLIRVFRDAGFIYHSEVCIWKDPVVAMQRTKALGLLHKQLKKDSCMSRQGIPDYLVTMRKPGDNPERVTHTNESFPVNVWQQYASPIWMDIKQSKTLSRKSARAEEDEKHVCPLQLEVIERAIELWTNPNDWVLSPFMGIGSEGYVALQKGRRFIGMELKESYFAEAVRNLRSVENATS